MANRTVLGVLPGGGLGLRVSRPGYNVLDNSITNSKLSFDSRWPSALNLFKVGSSTAILGGREILYGKTFAEIPVVIIVYSLNGRYVTMTTDGDVGSIIKKDRMIVSNLPTGQAFSYYVFAR